MNRLAERIIYHGAAFGLEPAILDATGHGAKKPTTTAATSASTGKKRGDASPAASPAHYHVLPSMYAQFGDDSALLHLSEAPTIQSHAKDAATASTAAAAVEAAPLNVRGTFSVCQPIVESVPANIAAAFKGALDRLLPTYDTIASLVHTTGAARPRAATGVVAGHKRFYPAHFSSYYSYGAVAASVAAGLDCALWAALLAVFALMATMGILATVAVLWVSCLASFAPQPVVNAPTPLSPTPIAGEWAASYLYALLGVGTFGSPSMNLRPPTSTPQHFAIAFQFIADNVRPSEATLLLCSVVLGLMIASAVFNLLCCYALALAPNALHRQWRSNGNNSMSSVIALAAHQFARRAVEHSAAVRGRAVRCGRHALLSLVLLKLTINMFMEMDKQGMFPLSRIAGAGAPRVSSAAPTVSPLEDLITTAAAFNRVVGFVSAVALAFVSAEFLSSRISGRFFMASRLPFFVKVKAPEEPNEERREVAAKERHNEFLTHAAICPRLPDRLRFRPEDDRPIAEPGRQGHEGRIMYYGAGATPDTAAGPEAPEALDWLTELAPFVMSADTVVLAECFRKLVSAAITTLWMLAFWRWPSGIPFMATINSLTASAAVLNGPVAWLAGLWTGLTSSAKGRPPLDAGSVFSLSSLVLGALLGVSIALLTYAARATAPSARVAHKRRAHAYAGDTVTAPTLAAVLGQPASADTFREYVAIWSAAQAAPFLRVLDHNSLPPADGDRPEGATPVSSTPTIPHTPTKHLSSATSRPMDAVASAYVADAAGLGATSVVRRTFSGLPLGEFVLMFASFIVTRQLILFPFVGLVTAAVGPALSAPRLSQPDVSLFGVLQAANPILIGALLIATFHMWYLVLGLLRDARAAVVDVKVSAELIAVIASRLALLVGRTNTPLFRPLRHAYCDGVYDLCHTGHKRVIERASACCDRLFAGTMCDEDCLSYKRQPVMSTAERAEEVARCQGVYRALPASPPKGLPTAFLAYYGITQVVYGEEYHKDTDVYYARARELGIGITAPRTESISTSDLLKRIQK